MTNQYRTTSLDTYQALHRVDPSQNSTGKRRQHLQAELLKLASSEEKPEIVDEKEQWKTTSFCDYAHEDIFPPTRPLGASKPESVCLVNVGAVEEV